jgi:hypothetical protein
LIAVRVTKTHDPVLAIGVDDSGNGGTGNGDVLAAGQQE